MKLKTGVIYSWTIIDGGMFVDGGEVLAIQDLPNGGVVGVALYGHNRNYNMARLRANPDLLWIKDTAGSEWAVDPYDLTTLPYWRWVSDHPQVGEVSPEVLETVRRTALAPLRDA